MLSMPLIRRYGGTVVVNVPVEVAKQIESLIDPKRQTKSDVVRELIYTGLRERGFEC